MTGSESPTSPSSMIGDILLLYFGIAVFGYTQRDKIIYAHKSHMQYDYIAFWM